MGLQGSESDTKILSKVRGMPVEQAVTMVRDKIEQKLPGGVPQLPPPPSMGSTHGRYRIPQLPAAGAR